MRIIKPFLVLFDHNEKLLVLDRLKTKLDVVEFDTLCYDCNFDGTFKKFLEERNNLLNRLPDDQNYRLSELNKIFEGLYSRSKIEVEDAYNELFDIAPDLDREVISGLISLHRMDPDLSIEVARRW